MVLRDWYDSIYCTDPAFIEENENISTQLLL